MSLAPPTDLERRRSAGPAIASGLAFVLSASCATGELPEAVRPLRPDALDPEVRALVDEHVAAVASDRGSADAHGELGLVYEASSLWPEASASFANAARLDPREVLWPYHEAIALLQTGDYDRSVAALRRITKDFPDFAPAAHRLGDALLETEDLDGAAAAFATAARLAPSAPEVHVGLGRVALQRGAYDEAVRELERALELDGDYKMAHFLLGKAYRGVGRDEDARRATERGVNAGRRFLPDAGTARLGRYATGMVAQLNRARAQLDAGRPAAAIEILEAADALRPDRPEILNSLAIAYGTAGDLDAALRTLQRALRADETNALTHANLAVALLDRGDAARALQHATRASGLDPTSARARFAEGSALMVLRRFDEAFTALSRARELNPKDANTLLMLGEAAFRSRHFAEAEACLTEAIQHAPRNVAAHLFLANALIELGRPAEARGALATARELAPDHPGVAAVAQRLAGAPR